MREDNRYFEVNLFIKIYYIFGGVIFMSIQKENFKKLEKDLISVYQRLKTRKIKLSSLIDYKIPILNYIENINIYPLEATKEGIYSVLMLCLDQYVFSENGDVLITDSQYDELHRIYMKMGGPQLIYPDHLESRWKMSEHKRSYMVGSIRKVYNVDDLIAYIRDIEERYGSMRTINWVIAPKYDGISACLEFRNNKFVQALTRGESINGKRVGEDITPMVRNIMNIRTLENNFPEGFLKVELLCPSQSFERLKNDFKNRRSATSAIVNAPKNSEYAPFIYAMPLLYDQDDGNSPKYVPEYSEVIKYPLTTDDIIIPMRNLLSKIRKNTFPYRIDGVILYPILNQFNHDDAMAEAMAYKINTAFNYGKIEYGYVSIGRTGKATPMIHIEPTEVNETIVEDVSLGSFQKFYKMHLMEDEIVQVFSAGDVIPQAKPSSPRNYPKNAEPLKIPEICPYCHSLLIDYQCKNSNCIRVKTGEITNFLIKMGVEEISDGTIESLFKMNIVRTISDLFDLNEEKIAKLPGFGTVSAEKIVKSIHNMQKTPITYTIFFGALGVPGCALKTWEKIFDEIPPKNFIRLIEDFCEDNSIHRYDYSKIYLMLADISGIGTEKRDMILKFFERNYSTIKAIMSKLNLVDSPQIEGEVVFTGFRDIEWSKKFEENGFRVANSVNKKTVAVIAQNKFMETGNADKARALGIALFGRDEIQEAIEYCKEYIVKRNDILNQMDKVLAAENYV